VVPGASGTAPAGRQEREEGLFFQKVVVSDLVQEEIKVVQMALENSINQAVVDFSFDRFHERNT
jgi:hypothetical protein